MIAEAVQIADGLHPGLGRAEYSAIPAISYSRLKCFARSAAHAREMMLHPIEPTEAMELGTALHAAILEPAKWADDYTVAPRFDRRTKIGKEGWAEFEEANRGRTLLTQDDADAVEAMARSVREHPLASQLIGVPGKNEMAVVWTDEMTGARCKGLVDRIVRHAGFTVICDLKKTRDASQSGFARQVANLQYHEQAAFYLSGLATVSAASRKWYWIAVEDSRPYAVAVYEPDEDTLNEGRAAFRSHLKTYIECEKSGVWPGYGAGVQSLRLPRWALQLSTTDEQGI